MTASLTSLRAHLNLKNLLINPLSNNQTHTHKFTYVVVHIPVPTGGQFDWILRYFLSPFHPSLTSEA